jgi:hypothetical protein
MADDDKTSELYPIAVLIDELKVRFFYTVALSEAGTLIQ